MTMTLEIKINLAQPPKEAPWNFPHQCLSLAFRIKAALAVLDGAEPWGKDDVASLPRFLAYRQLADLSDAIRHLFRMPDGSPAPFHAALKVIDVKFKRGWDENYLWERSIESAAEGFRGESHDWSTLTKVDQPTLKKEFLGHAQRLESIGIYFLRMMQAASGKNLPEEYVVQTEEKNSGWIAVLEAD